MDENGMYKDEVDKLTNEFKDDKVRIRELYYDNLRRKKELIEVHEVLVNKEIDVRKMKELIEVTRKEKSHSSRYELTKPESIVISQNWNLDKVKKKSDAAILKMKKTQFKIAKLDSNQQDKIRDIEHDVNILKIKIKEKGKEFSLANLKIREITRNYKYNALKPLSMFPTQSKKKSTSVIRKSTEIGRQSNLRSDRNPLAGRRNSTDDFYSISSITAKPKYTILFGSETKLDRSEFQINKK
jgi:hypothetical protein